VAQQDETHNVRRTEDMPSPTASNEIFAAEIPPEREIMTNKGADQTTIADEVPIPPVQRSTRQWKPQHSG
jgi:hypothetical protein